MRQPISWRVRIASSERTRTFDPFVNNIRLSSERRGCWSSRFVIAGVAWVGPFACGECAGQHPRPISLQAARLAADNRKWPSGSGPPLPTPRDVTSRGVFRWFRRYRAPQHSVRGLQNRPQHPAAAGQRGQTPAIALAPPTAWPLPTTGLFSAMLSRSRPGRKRKKFSALIGDFQAGPLGVFSDGNH